MVQVRTLGQQLAEVLERRLGQRVVLGQRLAEELERRQQLVLVRQRQLVQLQVVIVVVGES